MFDLVPDELYFMTKLILWLEMPKRKRLRIALITLDSL